MTTPAFTPANLVDKIMAWENGLMDDDEIFDFFQYLIDSGLAWTLQGCYGRVAVSLIESGHCHRKDGA